MVGLSLMCSCDVDLCYKLILYEGFVCEVLICTNYARHCKLTEFNPD